MIPFVKCCHCEEDIQKDYRKRHHYENHVEIPFEEKFFRLSYVARLMKKVVCKVCGFCIETRFLRGTREDHQQKSHPDVSDMSVLFTPKQAISSLAIQCTECRKFLEKHRLMKFPACPHGSLYQDCSPNAQISEQHSGNERGESSKYCAEVTSQRNKTTSISENSCHMLAPTKCKLCTRVIRPGKLESHMQRKHSENTDLRDEISKIVDRFASAKTVASNNEELKTVAAQKRRKIGKVECQLCGYCVEHKRYKPKAQIHWESVHPEIIRFDEVFDFSKAILCKGIKCDNCNRWIEPSRLEKHPSCPHGLRFESNETLKERFNKRRLEESVDRAAKVSKRNNDNEVTSTVSSSVQTPISPPVSTTISSVFIKCEICHEKVQTDKFNEHNQQKHAEEAIVLDSDEDDAPTIDKEGNASKQTDKSSHVESTPKKQSNDVQPSLKKPPEDRAEIEIEYYPIRVSKSELEKFLIQNRIYPKNGEFYLKDS